MSRVVDREWEFQGLCLESCQIKGEGGMSADGDTGSRGQIQDGRFREGYSLGLFLGEGKQWALEAQLKTH